MQVIVATSTTLSCPTASNSMFRARKASSRRSSSSGEADGALTSLLARLSSSLTSGAHSELSVEAREVSRRGYTNTSLFLKRAPRGSRHFRVNLTSRVLRWVERTQLEGKFSTEHAIQARRLSSFAP